MRRWEIAVLTVLLLPWAGTYGWALVREEAKVRAEQQGIIAENEEARSIARTDAGISARRILLSAGGSRSLEEYLPGVVACQMPERADTFSDTVWQCQAVIARTYICRLMEDKKEIHEEELDMDYAGDRYDLMAAGRNHAVRRLERAETAVRTTAGSVIKYGEEYILPMFHEMSAGETRTGAAEFPYLQSVNSSFDTQNADYEQEIRVSAAEFAEKISRITDREKVPAAGLPENIQTVSRDHAGYMEQLQIGPAIYTGDEIRYSLGLPSPHFSIGGSAGTVIIKVQGKGHGYGLSQSGAGALAQKGWDWHDILQYYYKGIEILQE